MLQVETDLSECGIALSEDEVKNMKKDQFKNLVKQKIRNLSKDYLISLRTKHSKSDKLTLENGMKKYLTSEKISLDEKKLLFAMQTRAVNVKTNNSGSYTKSNMHCRLCKTSGEDESEIHLMTCSQIISENNLKSELENISYLDVFGTLDKQIAALKVWKKLFRVWNI